MYNFIIIRSVGNKTSHLETKTTLAYPLGFEGVLVEKEIGTDCIRINGMQYKVPVNEMNCVRLNKDTFVSFGYLFEDEQ